MTIFQPNFQQTQRICELVKRHGNADNIGPDDWEEIASEIGFDRMWGQGIKEFYKNYIIVQKEGFTPQMKDESAFNFATQKPMDESSSEDDDTEEDDDVLKPVLNSKAPVSKSPTPKSSPRSPPLKENSNSNEDNTESKQKNHVSLSVSNQVTILGAKRPKLKDKSTEPNDIYWYISSGSRKFWRTNDYMKTHHTPTLLKYYEENLKW
eukprot:CAMPEP_0204839846 /NCGR_PEP_ID=MMETSP1346-20131115/35737_1 /ASSEMBLY_ACC=CAM_ASM_000771 /TAXON_ID=215587 /ORGANISM="Aplanochytrium stocchinoi, Strain GSBS06" /LENGTH=207 /DNA_ID=CAMNT_0051976897 /DNA_START=158 /DNA_END=778 /DNA_ORIENTATION=+